MNCENCGKEEVNYHLTSNINGTIIEKHLCTECAAKLGLTDKSLFKPEVSFEDAFMDLFGARPTRRMPVGYRMVFPTFIIPTVGVMVPGTAREENSGHPSEAPAEEKPEIDTEMQKRREMNILREQMRQAVEAENFEKAAAIRDSIKTLENGENS